MKNNVLPFLAMMMAILGISYSACQESKAGEKASGGIVKIRESITEYNELLSELQLTHEQNIEAYALDMGVNSNSQGLEEITAKNQLLEANRSRIEYHRLQLIQADTTNQTRNTLQLEEISADITKLKAESEHIKAKIGAIVNSNVPK